MRELRTDIGLEEADAWAIAIAKFEYHHWPLGDAAYGLMKGLLDGKPREDYPELFYKQPRNGSFGKFQNAYGDEVYGYLLCIENGAYVYTPKYSKISIRGKGYSSFTPGLPTDVDADGMPKEKS